MATRIITIALVLACAAVHAAWDRVAMPPVYFGIMKMEFANEGYGCALGNDENDDNNFLVYNNGGWGAMHLPGMFIGRPTDVSFLESGYGWVAGTNGGMDGALYTARRQAGGGWVFMHNPYENGPTPAGILAVSVAAEEEVWFLFDYPNYLLHYKDGAWEEFPHALPAQLGHAHDICFIDADEGWVAGSAGFAHYVGGTWAYVAGPSADRLDFTAADDGWATDYDGLNVYHYNGSSWASVFSVAGYTAGSISFCDRNNGWATFWKSETPPGLLYKYESGSWRQIAQPCYPGLADANSESPTCAWFIGDSTGSGPYTIYTYRWTTALNVEPTSLGRIKASFK